MLLFIRLFLEPKNHTIALGSVTNTAIEVLLSSSFYNVCLNALLQMKFFIQQISEIILMMQTQFLVSQLSPAITIVQCDAASTNIKRAIFFRHLLLHLIRYLFKYCLDIWCFTRTLERYLFKDSHSTEACDGCCKTSFQHRPLQPLIVSFLHFSQPGSQTSLNL